METHGHTDKSLTSELFRGIDKPRFDMSGAGQGATNIQGAQPKLGRFAQPKGGDGASADGKLEQSLSPSVSSTAGKSPGFASTIQSPEYVQTDEKGFTSGEKSFNFWTYNAVGYWANLGLSIAVMDFVYNWKSGQKALHYMQGGVSKAFGTFLRQDCATKFGNAGVKYLMLTMGGTLLMAPTKIVEDNKRKLVYWINKTWYPETIAADDPNKDKSFNQVMFRTNENDLAQVHEIQPKQSWGRALVRRAMGMAAVVGWGIAVEKIEKPVEDFFYDPVKGPIKNAAESTNIKWLGNYVNKPMHKDQPRVENHARWIMEDGLNTFLTAAITKWTNGAKTADEIKKDGFDLKDAPEKTPPESVPYAPEKQRDFNHYTKDTPVPSLSEVASVKGQRSHQQALGPRGNFVDSLQHPSNTLAPNLAV